MTVIALSGGVGGAKLALGLYSVLPCDSLTVVVNTGDDFDHFGLRVCPDIDTVLYTLSGAAHPEQGWGRRAETWTLMGVIEELGVDTWFKLGDGDTALHVVRTHRLRNGDSLSSIIDAFASRWHIGAAILPMTDSRVETRVETDEGDLGFQEYFVKRHCFPRVKSIRFEGAADASVGPGIIEALHAGSLEAIVLCPSNPYLSIDPLLAVPGLRAALAQRRVPLVAVSPLIAGKAIKGPTAKIMNELGIDCSAAAICEHYRGLIDAIVVDSADQDGLAHLPVTAFHTDIFMQSLDDRQRLAHFVLNVAKQIRDAGGVRE